MRQKCYCPDGLGWLEYCESEFELLSGSLLGDRVQPRQGMLKVPNNSDLALQV